MFSRHLWYLLYQKLIVLSNQCHYISSPLIFVLGGNSKVLAKSNLRRISYIILFTDFTSFIHLTNSWGTPLPTLTRYCPGQQKKIVKKIDSPVCIQPQLMTSSRFSVFRAGISFVMMCIFYTSAVDSPELSPQTFFSTLQPGKATLVYFCQAGKFSHWVSGPQRLSQLEFV